VLPWLYSNVDQFVDELERLGEFPNLFLQSNVDDFLEAHMLTVKDERDRKEAVRKTIEEAHH